MTTHNSSLLFCRTRPAQAGFTLVELMVGLAIGMLATLVVMQVFSVFEVQKRATTGTADAQTNGNIALYDVTRELQMAGYGLPTGGKPTVPDSALECDMPVVDVSTAGLPASAVSLSPVSIADGATSDSITVRYGSTLMGGVTTKISAAIIGDNALVDSNLGCAGGDAALVMNGATCALTRLVSGAQPVNTLSFIDNRAMTAGAAILNAKVACLGRAWNEITFAVDAAGNNLERNTVPVVAGIVNIQAQYGISDAANNNQVTAWVDAAGAPWGNPGVTDRNRIKAVRIAVVARSGAREEAFVTNTCTTAQGTVNNGPCAWDDTGFDPAPAINLGAAGGEWQHYRYKVFETIIPIRNVLWARGTL